MRLICSECGGQIEVIEYINSNDSFKNMCVISVVENA